MTDYSHIPVNIIVAKKKSIKKKYSEPSRFNYVVIPGKIQVGDYVTGIDDPSVPYSYTTKDSICKVVGISYDEENIVISIVKHRTSSGLIGREFKVSARFFCRIEYND